MAKHDQSWRSIPEAGETSTTLPPWEILKKITPLHPGMLAFSSPDHEEWINIDTRVVTNTNTYQLNQAPLEISKTRTTKTSEKELQPSVQTEHFRINKRESAR